jgi:leucyl/phenylalanyl-tRNA--protein transferase
LAKGDPDITPELLLHAYTIGVFPMARSRRAPTIEWYDPQMRGILPIDRLHVPKRLRRTIRQAPYRITFDRAFRAVMTGCADARKDTWINDKIIDLYTQLHEAGFAHSVEAWRGDELVGGVYGISIGGAFFGESMFSTATDASKIALVYLVARLWKQGYALLDTQFINEHLMQFGVQEIPRHAYHARLAAALDMPVTFDGQSSGSASALESSPPAPSNEPGSWSTGGIGAGFRSGAFSPATGAPAGAGLASGLASAAASSVSGDASVSSTGSSSGEALGLPSSSGACVGAFSDEKTSAGFAAVAAFLHSITQTS